MTPAVACAHVTDHKPGQCVTKRRRQCVNHELALFLLCYRHCCCFCCYILQLLLPPPPPCHCRPKHEQTPCIASKTAATTGRVRHQRNSQPPVTPRQFSFPASSSLPRHVLQLGVGQGGLGPLLFVCGSPGSSVALACLSPPSWSQSLVSAPFLPRHMFLCVLCSLSLCFP